METPSGAHERPPSLVRASVPFGPTANTSEADTALMRVNVCDRRPPSGAQVVPASSDTTVTPSSPAATTRTPAANVAASSLVEEGLTEVKVAPPSFVRISDWPDGVVAMQVSASAQRIRERAGPFACCSQVAPPFSVRSTRWLPTANPTVDVTKWTSSITPGSSRTSVHDAAASVVL